MIHAARWLVRLGAFLLMVSLVVPQCSLPVESISPFVVVVGLAPGVGTPLECGGLALWLFTPLLAGTVLLAGAWGKTTPPTGVRAFTLALLLLVSFVLSTLGSILLTLTGAGAQAPTASFPIAIALFVLPILLGGVALARLVGGDFARSSGGFARLSLGLLMALGGFFLVDSGWELLLAWLSQIGTPRALAGAWIAPAGGLMVAAGELLKRLRPRTAVDTAPASG